MDGEVLIIGKVVGWSGGVPKGLRCVSLQWGPWSFFLAFFPQAFFFDFFRFWADFGWFWEVETEAKIDFWEVFLRCFFRMRFGIDFGSIFRGSEP